MSSNNDENQNPSGSRAFRPTGPVRVGRIGDWNSGSASSSRGSSSNRIATLGGMGGGSPAPGRGDDDDSDEEDKKEGETWFAGGERSGVNVQNPNAPGGGGGGSANLLTDIFRRATENTLARQARANEPRRFTGGGYTLGGEDADSTYIPDAEAEAEANVATRYITFWRNGFQIADGELRGYDDPESRSILARIMSGQAPIDLLNVANDQQVDLQIKNRKGEDYVAPLEQRAAFAGSGHRLGAPVPSDTAEAPPAPPGAFPESSESSSSTAGPSEPRSNVTTAFEVDQTQPTTSVQIRFADGAKLVTRVNLTHTVGDIRNVINASQPGSASRPYTIATTFPNKVLDDDSVTIEAAKLQNSVVVQRWV